MSHFPPPPTALPASAPDDASDVPLWLILGGVGLIVLGLVAAGLVILHEVTATSGPTFPTAWDSRIAPYAKIAEKERGLTFMHPVAVRFLDDKPFEKTVTSDDAPTKQEQKAMDQVTGLLRAFGIIKGDLDLHQATNDASGGGVLAYYSFADKSITVRGTKTITPSMRATLVHELTHALQDQHFGIADRMDALSRSKAPTASTQADVLDAIIEGDANRVEAKYVASLTPRQRRAVDGGRTAENTKAQARTSKVPKVLLTMMSAPYAYGQALVETVAANGGDAAVDDLFRDAPTTEAALIDPFRLVTGKDTVSAMDPPQLQPGEKKLDSGVFGPTSLYLLLAARLPLPQALAAADAWHGDAYVAFTRAGTSCARISLSGGTPLDTTRMLLALQRWTAAAPGTPAKASLENGRVLFESCDPGASSDVGKDDSDKAVALDTTRTYFALGLMRFAKLPVAQARCGAGRLAQQYSGAQLADPKFGGPGRPERAHVMQVIAGCR